jgi:hypothetical protein
MKPKNAIESRLSNAGDDDLDFVIESNVPLPTNRSTARPKRHFPFDRLKAGQSFLVSKDKKKGLRPALARHYKANPAERKTIVIRPEGDGVRVWKKALKTK